MMVGIPDSAPRLDDKKRKKDEVESNEDDLKSKKETKVEAAEIRRLKDEARELGKAKKAQEKAEKEQEKVRRAQEKSEKEQERLKKGSGKAEKDEAKEKERIQKAKEKEAKDAEKETKRLKAQAEKEDRERKAKERDAKEAEKEMKKKKQEDALKKQASFMGKFLAKAISPSNSPGQGSDKGQEAEREEGSAQHQEERMQALLERMDSELAGKGRGEPTALEILEGYRRSWKSSSSVHRQKKPIRWGVRRLPKVEPIKDLRLQRPLLEQMRAVGPDVARGPTCSVDGEDDGDLEIIESESAGGVGRGASKTDRKPKRRRLIQLDHVRPPYYGDYGKDPPASKIVTGRRPLQMDPELDYTVDSGEEWEDVSDAEDLSDFDKDGAASDDGEEVEEDGFFVADGYLSADEGQQDMASSDDEAMAAEPGFIPAPASNLGVVNREELKSRQKVSRMIDNALKRVGKPLIITTLKVRSKEGEGGGEGEAAANTSMTASGQGGQGGGPVAFITADPVLLKGFAMEVLTEVGVTVPPAGEEDGGGGGGGGGVKEDWERKDGEKKRGASRVGKAFPEEDLPKLASILMQSEQKMSMKRCLEVLQDTFPGYPKVCLENSIRGVTDYVGNTWQVKPEVVRRFGLTPPQPPPPAPEPLGTSSFKAVAPPGADITKFLLKTPGLRGEGRGEGPCQQSEAKRESLGGDENEERKREGRNLEEGMRGMQAGEADRMDTVASIGRRPTAVDPVF